MNRRKEGRRKGKGDLRAQKGYPLNPGAHSEQFSPAKPTSHTHSASKLHVPCPLQVVSELHSDVEEIKKIILKLSYTMNSYRLSTNTASGSPLSKDE